MFLVFPCFLLASPTYPSDQIRLPCEILEVSPPLKKSSTDLNRIRYVLLHHANAADREALSNWLKTHSGTQVRFMINEKEYIGVLCRLAHCFGRGLLIHTADVRLKKRNIIDVLLSPPP